MQRCEDDDEDGVLLIEGLTHANVYASQIEATILVIRWHWIDDSDRDRMGKSPLSQQDNGALRRYETLSLRQSNSHLLSPETSSMHGNEMSALWLRYASG